MVVALCSARCVHAVTDDNLAVVSQVAPPDVLPLLDALMQRDAQTTDELLLQTLAAGEVAGVTAGVSRCAVECRLRGGGAGRGNGKILNGHIFVNTHQNCTKCSVVVYCVDNWNEN